MKKKTKHSPTPYRLGESTNDYRGKIIISRDNLIIAEMVIDDAVESNKEELSTAKFIVRAVNCHDELVTICRRIVAIAEKTAYSIGPTTVNEIKILLKKAEGL